LVLAVAAVLVAADVVLDSLEASLFRHTPPVPSPFSLHPSTSPRSQLKFCPLYRLSLPTTRTTVAGIDVKTITFAIYIGESAQQFRWWWWR